MAISKLDISDNEIIDLSDSDLVNLPPSLIDGDVNIQKNGVWTINSLKVFKPPIIAYVPYHILFMMRSIEAKMNPSPLEFGAFLKADFINGELHITEDFIVVKQLVTSVTIDFEEDPPEGFNGVIHRHPSGCTKFSGTDDTSINENYDFSLLYVNGSITYGIINLKVNDDIRLQVELKIKIIYPIDNSIDSLMDKIIKKQPKQKSVITNQALLGFETKTKHPLDINPEFDLDDLSFLDNQTSSSTDDDDDIDSEILVDLGSGFTYDGVYIYDEEDNIIESEDLPDECVNAYINASMDI